MGRGINWDRARASGRIRQRGAESTHGGSLAQLIGRAPPRRAPPSKASLRAQADAAVAERAPRPAARTLVRTIYDGRTMLGEIFAAGRGFVARHADGEKAGPFPARADAEAAIHAHARAIRIAAEHESASP